MDERARITYMSRVRLLLLFSALLSALTGAGSGVGRLQAAPAVAEQAIGGAVAQAPRAAMPVRPIQALPSVHASLTVVRITRPALPAIPLWANRRRE